MVPTLHASTTLGNLKTCIVRLILDVFLHNASLKISCILTIVGAVFLVMVDNMLGQATFSILLFWVLRLMMCNSTEGLRKMVSKVGVS